MTGSEFVVCTERTQARFELIPNVGVLGSLARQHTWDTHACLGLVCTQCTAHGWRVENGAAPPLRFRLITCSYFKLFATKPNIFSFIYSVSNHLFIWYAYVPTSF